MGCTTGVGKLLMLGNIVPVVWVLCKSGGGCEVRGAEDIIGWPEKCEALWTRGGGDCSWGWGDTITVLLPPIWIFMGGDMAGLLGPVCKQIDAIITDTSTVKKVYKKCWDQQIYFVITYFVVSFITKCPQIIWILCYIQNLLICSIKWNETCLSEFQLIEFIYCLFHVCLSKTVLIV